MVKTVIFDAGGVLVDTPVKRWNEFEKEHGLPNRSFLDAFIQSPLMPALERGECGPTEFLKTVMKVVDPAGRISFEKCRILLSLDDNRTKTLNLRPHMMDMVKAIRAAGMHTALLTNNWFIDDDKTTTFVPKSGGLPDYFDVIVESCRVSMRKPETRIYQTVLKKLNVDSTDAVFLDDLGHNLKTARALGIHTIKVVGDGSAAVDELERLLGFSLRKSTEVDVPGTVLCRTPLSTSLLIKYLRSHLPSISLRPRVLIRQFAHGQSNPTFYVRIDDREMVLRKKPPGVLLASAHDIGREYKVMSAVNGHGVPVPEMIHHCEENDVIGTAFYLMSFIRGTVFKDVRLTELPSAAARRRVYFETMKTLAAIHKVDIENGPLNGFAKKGGFLKRNYTRWLRQYELSKTEENPLFERLAKWLGENMPQNERCTLVHGDYRVDNVIFSSDLNVSAVLDWEISTLGDPLTDVATMLFSHYTTASNGPWKGLGSDLGDIPTVDELLECYSNAIGQTKVTTEQLKFYVAFVAFRNGSIIQGVYKRALSGQASAGSQATRLQGVVEKVSEIGLRLIETPKIMSKL